MAADSVARVLMASALEAGTLSEQIIVTEAVGGIPAGTVYSEGTPVSSIINDLLTGGTPPVVNVDIYYGATDNVPTDLTGLTKVTTTSTALLSTYSQHINAGNTTTKKGQYPVFAMPTGYAMTKWYVPGFEMDLPHTLVVNGGYNIYYLNVPSYDVNSGGIDYLIKVEVE